MAWERGVVIKTPEEVEIMREAGHINALALDTVSKMIVPGITTAELDAAADFLSFSGLRAGMALRCSGGCRHRCL